MSASALAARLVREDSSKEPQSRAFRENLGLVVATADSADDGIYRIKIIEAGEGSSGWYPAEVLERDGKRAFPIGTKSFLNHPTYSETWERPERDVTQIAGLQITEAEWDATDQSLYANVQFGTPYRAFIAENYKALGMSIYAYAESEFGTIGEYSGDIVTHLIETPLNSIDIVTVAGAGGAIVKKVSESFKRLVKKEVSAIETAAPTPRKEGNMDLEAKVDKLTELLTTFVTESKTAAAAKVEEPATPSAIESAVEAAVTSYKSKAEAVAAADLLPTQAAALLVEAAKGADIADSIETAKAIRAEALAAAAPKTPSTGYVHGESAGSGYVFKGFGQAVSA